MARYVLDACVLYPVVVRDLLLTIATFDVFEPIWTGQILDEMRRNVLADHPNINPAAFESATIRTMNQVFPDARITGYEPLIADMDNESKDRHVAAAAIHAEATAIVTYNVRDFQGRILARANIEILSPAILVDRLLDEDRGIVSAAVSSMARRKQRPPMTVDDVIQGFGALQPRLTDLD